MFPDLLQVSLKILTTIRAMSAYNSMQRQLLKLVRIKRWVPSL